MTRPISAIVERLRDSLGDGSIDDYYVRFFIGDVRAVVERLDACERVVAAARALRDSGYDGPMMGDEVSPLFAAIAALDGEGAER